MLYLEIDGNSKGHLCLFKDDKIFARRVKTPKTLNTILQIYNIRFIVQYNYYTNEYTLHPTLNTEKQKIFYSLIGMDLNTAFWCIEKGEIAKYVVGDSPSTSSPSR
ncbi:MAG: hypothetical protein A2901_07745 [Elusimicrobia bacterium RIFCSPLOWO2_01_FULL_54_10]|nr:MAG: hypothetical protein A2901_07745 [Elusimicrobia bacterium RIFCSPLOWO2_01_FULL_54_10]